MPSQKSDQNRSVQIVIVRHGKPRLDRNHGPRLNWKDYRDWWTRYEASELADGQQAPKALIAKVKDFPVRLSSMRKRAIQTAEFIVPGKKFEKHAMFNEAPLPPPCWEGVKFLPKTWNILARIAWLFGHVIECESYGEAKVRAYEGAKYLVEQTQKGDVLLAAHGWFNWMLKGELEAIGWTCVYDGGNHYWGWRVFTPR